MNKRLKMTLNWFRSSAFILLPSSFILLFLTGCQAIGALANAVPQSHKADYAGLAGQSVGVMVWADRAIRIDWPSIQLDLASRIEDDLRKSTASEVKGARWPTTPMSVVKYQHDHPEIEFTPVAQIAPKLGVTRLLYIELQSLTTRSDISLQTFRGTAICSLKIIEVDPIQHTTKVGYEEAGIHAIFPPKSTEEGVYNLSDITIYRGLVPAISSQIADRVASREAD